MANQDDVFKKVIAHAKEYGYVFQSSELYDGLAAVYDYGSNGSELKKNIKDSILVPKLHFVEYILWFQGVGSSKLSAPTISSISIVI